MYNLKRNNEYDSAIRKSRIIEEFYELFQYRDLIFIMIMNNIKRRYKRSTIGVIWTLLNPLITMGVLTVAFSTIFRFSLPDYPIYLLSGLLFWNFFSQATSDAMNALVWGASLIKRVYIPKTIFTLSVIGTGIINLFLSIIPLIIIMLLFGHSFKISLLFLPISIVIIAIFILGTSLFFSTIAVFFIDVLFMYQALISAWFYLTPIIYPKEIIPSHFLWFLYFNPLYYLLELFRLPIYDGIIPGIDIIFYSILSTLIALIAGWWVFAKKVEEIAYRI